MSVDAVNFSGHSDAKAKNNKDAYKQIGVLAGGAGVGALSGLALANGIKKSKLVADTFTATLVDIAGNNPQKLKLLRNGWENLLKEPDKLNKIFVKVGAKKGLLIAGAGLVIANIVKAFINKE